MGTELEGHNEIGTGQRGFLMAASTRIGRPSTEMLSSEGEIRPSSIPHGATDSEASINEPKSSYCARHQAKKKRILIPQNVSRTAGTARVRMWQMSRGKLQSEGASERIRGSTCLSSCDHSSALSHDGRHKGRHTVGPEELFSRPIQ